MTRGRSTAIRKVIASAILACASALVSQPALAQFSQQDSKVGAGDVGTPVYQGVSVTGLAGTVQAVAVDPTNGQIVYAGTTTGIYRTANGGSTWSRVWSGGQDIGLGSALYTNVRALAIRPNAPCTISAGIDTNVHNYGGWPTYTIVNSYGILALSADCGATWQIPSPGERGRVAESLAFSSTGPDVLYAAIVINDATCYSAYPTGYCIDKLVTGTSQIRASTSTARFDYLDANPGVVATDPTSACTAYYGRGSRVYKNISCSDLSWAQVGATLSGNVLALAVHPTNQATLLAGTSGGQIYRKVDALSPWITVATVTGSIASIVYEPGNTLVAYAAGSGGVVYKTTDGGGTWSPGVTIGSGISSLAISAAAPNTVYAGTVAGSVVTVMQPGSVTCSYGISPVTQSFPATGGTGTISVTSTSGCAWTAASNAGFVTVTGSAGGTGSGTVTFAVAAATAARSGTLTVAGLTFTVSQAPATTTLIDRYRLYSPVTLEHLYTTDFNEYTVLGQSSAWQQEGVASKLHNGPVTVNGVAAVPYYRLYDKIARWHHWTTDLNEYTVLGANTARYNQEGIDGYIFKTQVPGTVPWYRLLFKNIPGLHTWTADQNERNVLVGSGTWIEETREYVFPAGTPTAPAVMLTQNGLQPARALAASRAGADATGAKLGRSHVLDLNGDGVGDVFLYNPATGAWRAEVTIPLTGGFTEQVGAWVPGLQVYPSRLNADAFTDFVVYDPAQGTWAQALNAGDGSFTYTSGTWEPGVTVVTADLDGDGVTDVLRYNAATGAWARDLVDGVGGFSGGTTGNWDPGWTITAADLTGDGRDDLLRYNAQTGAWLEAVSQADGTFAYPASGLWATGWQLSPADLDGDGRADLVLLSAAGTHASAVSRAGGGFGPLVTGQWDAGATLATGDLNADGRDDVFVYTPATGAWVEALSDASGGFTAVAGQAAPGYAVALTDLDADGLSDLLFTRADGVWVVTTNTGAGTFTYTQGSWGTGWTVFTRIPADR